MYQAWFAEFLLEINLKILLRKTGARLNFRIALLSLHIDPVLGTLFSVLHTFIEYTGYTHLGLRQVLFGPLIQVAQ
jgi:hypothetical protein